MKKLLPKPAYAFAALVAIAAAPLTASFAETTMSSPNAIDKTMVDFPAAPHFSTGIYDSADQYLDSKGFPLPGWTYISRPPS